MPAKDKIISDIDKLVDDTLKFLHCAPEFEVTRENLYSFASRIKLIIHGREILENITAPEE